MIGAPVGVNVVSGFRKISGSSGKITRDADNLCRRAGNEYLDAGAIYEMIVWLASSEWVTAQQAQLVVRGVRFVSLGPGSLCPMDSTFELDTIEAVLH